MPTKPECEKVIRSLADDWGHLQSDYGKPDFHPSFSKFETWLNDNGYQRYMNFKSRTGARYDAEMWFDQELNQTWRN